MRAGGVKFDKEADWWPTFEDECLTFPRAKHDDIVDALSYQGILMDLMCEGYTSEEIAEEECENERREGEYADIGRSSISGY